MINSLAEQVKSDADVCFRQEKFEDAVNFYTQAISIDASFFSCYANRACCFLKLNKAGSCINDCSFVIEHIHQHDAWKQHAARLLLKCYLRRGAALCMIGSIKAAYEDFESATRMAPSDSTIVADMALISSKLEQDVKGNTSINASYAFSADWLKNRGNFFYEQGDYDSAIHAYSMAMNMDKANPVYCNFFFDRVGTIPIVRNAT